VKSVVLRRQIIIRLLGIWVLDWIMRISVEIIALRCVGIHDDFFYVSTLVDIRELERNRVRMMIKLAANATGDEGLRRLTKKSYGRLHGFEVRTSLPPIVDDSVLFCSFLFN